MRWRFAQASHEDEMSDHQVFLDRVDAFWRAFEANLDAVTSSDASLVVGWVTSELPKVSPDFMWEISPEINGERRIVITPESNYSLLPLVEVMLQRAPSIKGLRFMTHREPIEAENVIGMMQARMGRWLPDVRVEAHVTEWNAINLLFYSDRFAGSNSPQDVQYCFILCEVILGQRILEQWVGMLETRSTRPSLFARLASMWGQPPAQLVPESAKPVESLPAVAHGLIESMQAALPDKPLWQNTEERKDAAVIMFEEPGSNRVLCLTTTPQVIVATKSPPGCFISERFSRCGETFCYLKIEEPGSNENADPSDQEQQHDAIDAALKKAQVGAVTGGGSGPNFNFVDLALADIDAALPVLRQVSSALGLPKRTWLRFLDAKLRDEWVGMYLDTPTADAGPDW